MKWIESTGGPLILLPNALTHQRKSITNGDYDRACAVSTFLGKISVGNGSALVLGDTPDSTSIIDSVLGPSLLRWVAADSEEAILKFAESTITNAAIIEELELLVDEQSHLLVDSACTGDNLDDSLELRLPKGIYRVTTRKHAQPRTQYVAHVFEKR